MKSADLLLGMIDLYAVAGQIRQQLLALIAATTPDEGGK